MSQINYYTEGGLKKLKDDLHRMKSIERPSITKQIAEARDKGDLSENAEYDAAKEAQGLLEARIANLENVLANARVVDETQMDTSKAYILSKVKIKNLNNNMVVDYQLVAQNEADLKSKKLSIESPIGKGLLGQEKGAVVEIEIPAGLVKFEILEITR